MRPADRTEYIVSCIREAGSMYPQDAKVFLAEHDAHRRTEAAAAQMAFAREHWTSTADDSISTAGKKDRKYGVAEKLASLIDPTTALRPRFIRVLPHDDGFLVRWQVGEESKATFKATEAEADAAASELRGLAASGTRGKDTCDGTQPPAGESTQPAPDRCGRALATGQPCPDHPLIPRTERSYWVTIADALNAAAAAGMHVGIDLDGTLTDHNAWSVIWDRESERWTVAGYDDDLPDAPASACGQCRRPFDPTDTRWNGEARHGDTPYCRACVDRCHDSEIADHRCLVCAKGGAA